MVIHSSLHGMWHCSIIFPVKALHFKPIVMTTSYKWPWPILAWWFYSFPLFLTSCKVLLGTMFTGHVCNVALRVYKEISVAAWNSRNLMTIVDVSGPILGRGPLFCQFSYKATTKSSYSGWSLSGGFYCSYNVYFITFRQNERSSKVFIKNMCSQGKKSLEMELTLILLITLIWLSVYKKNIFLILLFKIHKEKNF